MNKLEFRYTFKEFFEGSVSAIRSLWVLPVLGLLYFALLLFLYLTGQFPVAQEGGPIWAALNIALWLVGVVWVSFPLLQTWRVWRGNPLVRGVYTCWADEEGFRAQTANSDVTIKWPAFINFRETRKFFLIYASKHSCCLIPKRAFMDESQVKEFRELLDRKFSQRR